MIKNNLLETLEAIGSEQSREFQEEAIENNVLWNAWG
jgi:hypothetical protein